MKAKCALALVLCGFLLCLPRGAIAQGTDLRIVAPSAPGSGWDQIARTLRLAIAERGGLAADVVNVPGSGGLVGLTQFLARQPEADMLVTGLTMLDASVLARSTPAFERLTPIVRLSSEFFGLLVPATSPVNSVADLRAALALEPRRVTWAGGPIGGIDHVAAILLFQAAGLQPKDLNYVSFLTSAEAATAAAEDRVAAAILPLNEAQAELAAGRVRLLGVSGPDRLADLDVPTLTEAGMPLVFANWRGIAGRPDLPPEEQDRLARLVRDATASPAWQLTLESRRWRSAYLPPNQFQAFVREDKFRIKEALKAAGLIKRPD